MIHFPMDKRKHSEQSDREISKAESLDEPFMLHREIGAAIGVALRVEFVISPTIAGSVVSAVTVNLRSAFVAINDVMQQTI